MILKTIIYIPLVITNNMTKLLTARLNPLYDSNSITESFKNKHPALAENSEILISAQFRISAHSQGPKI